jgi:hypothetical protein
MLAQQNLRHPEGVDDYPIRAHANTTLTRLVGWVNSASYHLFREWAEWPVERFPARSISSCCPSAAILGPEHGKFCIVLLSTQCEEVSMKCTQLRFPFRPKCLAIRYRLLTEFFLPKLNLKQL